MFLLNHKKSKDSDYHIIEMILSYYRDDILFTKWIEMIFCRWLGQHRSSYNTKCESFSNSWSSFWFFLNFQKLGRVFEKLGQVFESHGRIQNIRIVKSSLHVLESNNSFKILIELQLWNVLFSLIVFLFLSLSLSLHLFLSSSDITLSSQHLRRQLLITNWM